MGIVFETITRDLAAVLTILIVFIWVYARHAYSHWERKGLNFLMPQFPFGTFKDMLLQRQSFGDLSCEMYNSTDEPVVGIWQAFRPTLMVRDPAIVRQIFIKDFNSFHSRGLYCDEKRDPLSGNLFLLPGEKWRHLRNKLSPTFTSGKLKAMFKTLVDCGAPLDTFLDKTASEGAPIEIRELLAEYTTNIIASVAFGIETDCIGKPNESFRKCGRQFFDLTLGNGLRQAILFLFPQIMPWIGLKSVSTDVEQFILGMVKDNMEYRENKNVTRRDFFQLLVQLRNTGSIQADDNFEATSTSSNKSLSIEECAAQAFVFFTAGFETSSTTMSFALYEMANNPECMRRAQQEIDEVLAKHDGHVTYDSVAEMKYLDWCIDESLRMYPPVPALPRECNTNWTVPNTNITIDKGTAILIPAMALQRDPKYWPQPDLFNPERFSPEQSADQTFIDRPYMPFGDGPRNCIGIRLGKIQTKLGLIVMLQKYSYELTGSSKLPLKMVPTGFLLSPVGGINVKITRRQTQ